MAGGAYDAGPRINSDHNPLIDFYTNLRQDADLIALMLEDILKAFDDFILHNLLQWLTQLTGIDFTSWETAIDAVFMDALNLFLRGQIGNTGFDLVALLINIIELLDPLNLFGPSGSLSPTNLITDVLKPLGLSISQIPLLGPLFSIGGTLLDALIPGLDASKIVTGSLASTVMQPLIDAVSLGFGGSTGLGFGGLQSFLGGLSFGGISFNDLIALFSNASSGLTGSAGLGSIFSDLTGLLGNPTALGSGTPVLPGISSIPLLSGLLSGGNILSSIIPGIDASKITSGAFPMAMVNGLNAALNTLTASTQNALTSVTAIPAYLLSHIQPGATHNLLPDPFFAAADLLDGSGLWNWSSLAPAGTPPGSGSAVAVAAGTASQLLGVPIKLPPVDQIVGDIQVGASVFWSGVVATGQSFVVAVNSYSGLNADGSLIEPPITDPNRVAASISNPASASSSHPSADANGFVPIIGQWIPPVGAQYAAISLEVANAVTAGTVHFGSGVFSLPSVIDASKLGNIENIPQLLGSSVAGILGLTALDSSLQSVNDTMYETITGLVTSGETSLANLANAFNTLLGVANNGQSLGQSAINVQNIVFNQMVSNGLESTVESNMPLQSLGTGPSYVSATQANSRGAPVRVSKTKNLGFVQIWQYYTGTITHFYLNFYKMDASGNLTFLYSSVDLASSLASGSAAATWLVHTLETAIAVAPGDNIAVGCQVVGSGTVFIAGVDQSAWMKNHPLSRTKMTGFTQNWGTGSASSIAAASVGWSGAAPYIGLGVSDPNVDYHPAEIQSYPNPGTYTYNLPTWMKPGDIIDYAVLGAGAGGYPGQAYGVNGLPGLPGNWTYGQLVYGDGHDIPTATTSLTIVTGAGGLGGIYGDGSRPTYGGNSSLAGTGVTTKTGAGGATQLGYGNPLGPGVSPPSVTIDTITYQGGGAQPNYASPGVAPGGGGPGGNGTTQGFGPGGPGANGEVWVRAHQAGT